MGDILTNEGEENGLPEEAPDTQRRTDPGNDLARLTDRSQSLDPCRGINSDIGYSGLRNQGATCYLNTVLQMLYLTPGFSEALEREEGGEGGVVSQLKRIFSELKTGEGSTVGLTQTLGIRNVHEQQDAAEYFLRILNSLNPHLSQMFQGSVRNSTVCVRGQHEASVECCPFLILPLPLLPSGDSEQQYSLEDSWCACFRSSVLDGDNQMYCDICEEKTDAEAMSQIEEYPQVLMLHLKRFEFDYTWMRYTKNSSIVEIPLSLNVEKHRYDLYAIADHVGSYTGGHYFAHIRSYETQSWYTFNDARVEEDQLTPQDVIRSRNAYLLMYMKSKYTVILGPDHTLFTC
ncbi:ubiquitin carboxyl-terminal hydrolase 47 isoform X2 [Conger conger]|uniref:ubiquitin carboxyl-terminal hydrolase 47 isoform X2 n=1 Tax=Conger conger TaxID=82655 RepID=UPI002A5AFF14|nr:ubiquitin carboxyl-terminal hydrolase 47 isoform X2 [Conger conger]